MTLSTRDAVYARNERLSWRVLDGEAVILYPEAGTLHRLNPTGTRIWDELNGERSIADIVGRLTVDYDVSEEQATTEVRTLLTNLIDKGLVEVRS